jgi:hypothetical protein
MNLVACRYNPNHKMKQTRLLIHEESCPDKKGKNLKMCPYNPVHKVAPENYERHKQICDQRPKVDPEVEQELKEYLKNLNKQKEGHTTNIGNISSVNKTSISNTIVKNESKNNSESECENLDINRIENHLEQSELGKPNQSEIRHEDDENEVDISTISEIKKPKMALPTKFKPRAPESLTIGLRNSVNEKKIKKERKMKQREMMQLIENAEFDESNINILTQTYLEETVSLEKDEDFININMNNPTKHGDELILEKNENFVNFNYNEINQNFDKQSVNTIKTENTLFTYSNNQENYPFHNRDKIFNINPNYMQNKKLTTKESESQFIHMINNINENEYDPNQSDIFISKNNKNFAKVKQQKSDLSFSIGESFIMQDDN